MIPLSKYFRWKDRFDRHIQSCAGIPGVFYKFQNRNLVTFQDNLKCKNNLLFVAYCNFETRTTPKLGFDAESDKKFAVSYVIIFPFHPKQNPERIIIQRSNTFARTPN